MANKRNIKKDIDFLVYEIVSDCYTFKYLFPDKDHKDADKVVKEAIDFRNELFMRVNHPDGKNDKKLVKAHYKKINEDLLNKADNYFERLNKMLSKQQEPEAKPEKKTEKPTAKAEKEEEKAE